MDNYYCIFSALYLPHVGGVEKYTYSLARELAALGNRVAIVTNNTEGAPARSEENGIQVFRLPCANVMGGRFPVTKNGRETAEVLRELESAGVDRVIVNTRFYPLSLIGLSFAQRTGTVPILIDHGSAHLTTGNALVDPAIQAVEHFMTRRAKSHPARYFGVSRKSVEWLRHFGIQGEGVLNNSIDAEAFRSASSGRDILREQAVPRDAFTVAFTGRLAPEKGVRHLAQAAALLQDAGIHVLMAGGGVLAGELQANATPNLHLLGPLPSQDVASLLLQCDAFCMPTRSEGFSTSLLEAASCGLALVSTDVGGVDELVPSPEFGRILPGATAQDIACVLQELASDRELCRTLGANARQRVEAEFTWKMTARKVEEAFAGRA